ncbi:hypothetical protein V1477_000090 [Vespula maculifrons]|uniref:Uncharacterized protein n=1 Tax=Vespula maculifrons TaxID=7453 RepID=A0ABD2D2K3_VESMC
MERKIFSLTIFFSETIAPRKTRPEPLEREPSYEGLKGTKKKKFYLTIFFSETIAPRKTGPGSLERALRALHAHHLEKPDRVHRKGLFAPYTPMFFLSRSAPRKTVPGPLERALFRPTRPYFFYQDLTNRSRVITHLEKPDWGRWKGIFAPYTPIFFWSRYDQ